MSWRVFWAAVILFLVGCSQAATTNQIHSKRSLVTAIVPREQPLSVELSQLQRAPEAYEGTLIRVSGEYRRAPVIVCDSIARVSPATWRLSQGDIVIGAGGVENLMRTLLPPGLTVTVDGVWRFWRGPVGCGKDAPLQSVWYLAVTNIVSPSPLARVTLTPSGGAPAETPETDGLPAGTATLAATEPVETPVTGPSPTSGATTAPTNTSQPATAAATQTPSATATVEGDGESTLEPTTTPQATANGTITATATVANGATATPSPSATPGGSVVDRGGIDYQDLRGGRLNSNETHSWQFPVQTGDVITISVAARADADIALTVLDPAGNRVVVQNDSPAGQIESISGLEAEGSGGYRIVIAEASASETHYSLLLLNNNEANFYNFIFSGLLSYGRNASSSMEANTDQFWFFFGNSQETVNINVAPTDQSDLFIDLYGPEGNLLEQEIDNARGGGAEQLLNFRLPATGMFAIRVGENSYEEANFTILVSRN